MTYWLFRIPHLAVEFEISHIFFEYLLFKISQPQSFSATISCFISPVMPFPKLQCTPGLVRRISSALCYCYEGGNLKQDPWSLLPLKQGENSTDTTCKTRSKQCISFGLTAKNANILGLNLDLNTMGGISNFSLALSYFDLQ